MIFFSNPKAQYNTHKDEIDAAIANVLSGTRFILGPNVTSFEEEFANYTLFQEGITKGRSLSPA